MRTLVLTLNLAAVICFLAIGGSGISRAMAAERQALQLTAGATWNVSTTTDAVSAFVEAEYLSQSPLTFFITGESCASVTIFAASHMAEDHDLKIGQKADIVMMLQPSMRQAFAVSEVAALHEAAPDEQIVLMNLGQWELDHRFIDQALAESSSLTIENPSLETNKWRIGGLIEEIKAVCGEKEAS